MTGRSGGGSYTWTVAALDERVKVAAPVAGMTDLRNQVVDGCIEGHCDCMFFLNTYRWDFPQVAALDRAAPVAHRQLGQGQAVPSGWRGAALQPNAAHLPALRQDQPAWPAHHRRPARRYAGLAVAGVPLVQPLPQRPGPAHRNGRHKTSSRPEQLRVFDKLPEDQVNTKIEESFRAESRAARPARQPGGGRTAASWIPDGAAREGVRRLAGERAGGQARAEPVKQLKAAFASDV